MLQISKKYIVLSLLAFNTLVYATPQNLEEAIYQEQYERDSMRSIVKAHMMINKAIRVGKVTIKSLQANLHFIEKIETSSSFRDLVVLKLDLKRVQKLKESAKKLYLNHEVTKVDYENYIFELQERMNSIKIKIKNNKKKEK